MEKEPGVSIRRWRRGPKTVWIFPVSPRAWKKTWEIKTGLKKFSGKERIIQKDELPHGRAVFFIQLVIEKTTGLCLSGIKRSPAQYSKSIRKTYNKASFEQVNFNRGRQGRTFARKTIPTATGVMYRIKNSQHCAQGNPKRFSCFSISTCAFLVPQTQPTKMAVNIPPNGSR